MKKLIKFFRYWLPVLIWAAFIFFLSSQTRVRATTSYVIDFIIFKLLHIFEYGVLYSLLFRALYSIDLSQSSFKKRALLAVVLSLLFASSDEMHQLFTPTRNGQLKDVFIDFIGIYIMYIYINKNIDNLKKFLS